MSTDKLRTILLYLEGSSEISIVKQERDHQNAKAVK